MSRCKNVSKWKWKCLSFLMFFLPEFDCSILKMNCRKMVGKWSHFSEFVYLLTDISLWRICKICHKYTERKNVSNRIFLWVYICWKIYKISIWEMLEKWGHLQLYNCWTLQNSSISLSPMKLSLVFTFFVIILHFKKYWVWMPFITFFLSFYGVKSSPGTQCNIRWPSRAFFHIEKPTVKWP